MDQIPPRTASPFTAAGRRTTPPAARVFGPVNWLGLWTLYAKEVRRFLKVFTQTVMAPVVTGLLFLAIFTLAIGRSIEVAGGIPYGQFLAPGLVMMVIVQNSFANNSSSILISKIQGNIVDVLMPPLSPVEMTVAYALAGMTRGVIVAVSALLAMALFVPMDLPDPAAALYFGASAALMLSLTGMIGGIWAEKFDHISAVTNFVITPLAFLSGSFYSIERLPGVWNVIAHFNPFFYLIDGFRSGFIGHSDGSTAIGVGVTLALNLILGAIALRMIATGYKLKS
jgi:ABC-2 type transport system permease protein